MERLAPCEPPKIAVEYLISMTSILFSAMKLLIKLSSLSLLPVQSLDRGMNVLTLIAVMIVRVYSL